jgi:hypothetical protein
MNMPTNSTYTRRDNAIVAAKKLIASGNAPASEFEIDRGADGRFAIRWLVAPKAPIVEETETKAAQKRDNSPAGRARAAQSCRARRTNRGQDRRDNAA